MEILTSLVAKPGTDPFILARLKAGAVRDNAHADQIALYLQAELTREAKALKIVVMAGEPGQEQPLELYGPADLCRHVELVDASGQLAAHMWTSVAISIV